MEVIGDYSNNTKQRIGRMPKTTKYTGDSQGPEEVREDDPDYKMAMAILRKIEAGTMACITLEQVKAEMERQEHKRTRRSKPKSPK